MTNQNNPNAVIDNFITQNAAILRPNQLRLIEPLKHNVSEIAISQIGNVATINYKHIGISASVTFEMLKE
jgi:hypothetical protein